MDVRTNLVPITTPPITKEFHSMLDKAFPILDVKPGMSKDEIMFTAGQRSVIAWCSRAVRGNDVSGNTGAVKNIVHSVIKQLGFTK